MANALESASLVMIPSGYEDGTLGSLKPTDGTGDFTFSRGSDISATRVNADGYIEKGYENLLYPSNDFSVWNKTRTSITSGQIGYDGSTDAWLLEALVTSQCWISKSHSATGICSFSVYAKANTATGVLVAVGGTSGTGYARFDLANGVTGSVVGNGVASSIEAVGDGWYRCSMFTTNTTITLPLIYVIDDVDTSNATAGNSIYIQDAMLNQGLVAYPYIETTTAPVAGGILEDMPRLDYSSCPALLLEPQRTNVLPYSEYFQTWFTNATLTSNYGISPEGVRNSTRVNYSGNNQYLAIGFQGVAGTGSIYVKGVSGETINIGAGSAAGGSLHTLNGDWQRVSFYDDGTSPYFSVNTYFGTARDIEVFGAQVEQNATYETSYIPTYGVSQTRLADVCVDAGDASTFNDSEGVLFFDGYFFESIIGNYISITNGLTTSNSVNFRTDTINRFKFFVGSYNYLTAFNEYDVTERHKIALVWSLTSFKVFIDGVKKHDAAISFTPTQTFSQLSFANHATAGMSGNVNQALVFPTALTDSECIELTTI